MMKIGVLGFFKHRGKFLKLSILILALLLMASFGTESKAVVVNVVDNDGVAVSGFRYLVEEDTTHNIIPGVRTGNTLSVLFHGSHAPVVASGNAGGQSVDISLPAGKRYFVSVLPNSGHALGGISV
ncbi:MAG: hypothetical protein JRD68_15800, partial [Deltaproteobacteria bacterium]|nr:hypothetical protein [Deltaproteobacteria bacterium]